LNDEALKNTIVGLRDLTEADIEQISEEVHKIVLTNLNQRTLNRDLDAYDIGIDIDNTKDDLRIDIDISLNLPPRMGLDEEVIIKQTLEDTFAELDKLLKEKFSQ